MNSSIPYDREHPSRTDQATPRAEPRGMNGLARRAVLRVLSRIRDGVLTTADRYARVALGTATECGLHATMHVHDDAAYHRIFFGGTLAAAESFMDGEWSADDLTALLRIVLRNAASTNSLDSGFARLIMPLLKAWHALRRNSRHGSRRNIAAHYDLGNEFFELFLDETMMYSSAWFAQPDMSLAEASVAKIDMVCRKLELSRGDHLLEIGTGWGGLAIHAAQNYGCRVTTTTISRRQHDYAAQRIAAAGLSDRVTLLLKDYRDLSGTFDKIVSIEMIEAVGWRYFDTFFRTCAERLRPDGRMLIQAITIADNQYERTRRSVDFIQRYIFPGSCIPSIAAMMQSVARATDFTLFDTQDMTTHYANTLRLWRERFMAAADRVHGAGFDDRAVRMWHYYFCYCEAGFLERNITSVQMLFAKPACRPNPVALR